MPELPEGYQGLVLAIAVPALCCLLVLFGWRLKRQTRYAAQRVDKLPVFFEL